MGHSVLTVSSVSFIPLPKVAICNRLLCFKKVVRMYILTTRIFISLQYIELARTLRYYGQIPAGEAVTDACNVAGSIAGTTCRVRVSLASKELTLATLTQPTREQRYKVTRMRCWRITTLHSVSFLNAN